VQFNVRHTEFGHFNSEDISCKYDIINHRKLNF